MKGSIPIAKGGARAGTHGICVPGIGAIFAVLTAAVLAQNATTTQATVPEKPSPPAPASPSAEPSKAVDASAVRVNGGDRVDIHVADAPLSTILKMLSAQSKKNIIASPAVSGTVTADLYNVTFTEALEAILKMNNCAYEERGKFIYVYTAEEMRQLQEARVEEPMVARLFRLNYVTVKDAQALIEPILSPQGKTAATPASEVGLETDATTAGGNTHSGQDVIMVYDVASRMEYVEKVIQEFDVRPKQVLIEATILRADLTEDNALGIDFTMVSGVDFEMLGSTSPGVTDINTGNVPQPELNNTNSTLRTDFNANVPGGGLSFGIIKDQIGVFLRALESVTDTTVLANPKVLTLNKQRGIVIVGRRDGYLTTTVTETTAIQTVEFLETGTQLVFRPFVGDDGYVRMEIHPEDSTGSLNESNLPFETTTEVTTNILVRDGHTILIGGLFRESTNSVRNQVPIVGNIPGLGALFRSSDDVTTREEVIILLTVRVVDDEQYAEASEKIAEDALRVRLGKRRGVLAFGRDRLALAHYHMALQHLKAGRMDKALWDARLSLHISPTYLPAIKLKEKLVGAHSCDYRAGIIRDVIARRLMGTNRLEQFGPPSPARDGKLDAGPPYPEFPRDFPEAFSPGELSDAPPEPAEEGGEEK